MVRKLDDWLSSAVERSNFYSIKNTNKNRRDVPKMKQISRSQREDGL
jgi:hypothetical protein